MGDLDCLFCLAAFGGNAQGQQAPLSASLAGSLLISYDSNIGRSVEQGPLPNAGPLPWDGGLHVEGGRSHSHPPVPRRHYVKKMVGTRQTEHILRRWRRGCVHGTSKIYRYESRQRKMARRLDEGYQEFLSWVTTERWREEGVYRTSSDFNKTK